MDMKDMNLMGIIGIIGAVLLVIGVFIGWLQADTTAMKLLFGTTEYTGWDIQNNLNDITAKTANYSGLAYSFVPLVCLICGIISLLLMVVPTFMNVEKFAQINNILGIIALILAIVAVICGFLFEMQTCSLLGVEYKLTEQFKIGMGFWLCIIGAIITVIGGIMPILKNKGIINF